MNLEHNNLVKLSKDEISNVNGGWINPVAAYMGACYLAYELGYAVGKALYNMIN
jgi:lactobin A/cerein 7B family class IIb bacteriocin